MMSESLGATHLGIRRPNWAGCSKHGTIAVEHDKSSVLVGEPTKGGERNYSVRSDYNQTSKTMTHTRKTGCPTLAADTILKDQMSAINTNADAVTKEGYDSASRC